MKKILITLMAVIYLGVSSGATVHFHYCMGQLINWGLAHKSKSTCDNCGMEKGDSEECCKDEQQQLKVDKAQKTTEQNLQLKQYPAIAANYLISQYNLSHSSTVSEKLPLSNAPPLTVKTSTFLLNCSFRI